MKTTWEPSRQAFIRSDGKTNFDNLPLLGGARPEAGIAEVLISGFCSRYWSKADMQLRRIYYDPKQTLMALPDWCFGWDTLARYEPRGQ
jgi:hypothetical protein